MRLAGALAVLLLVAVVASLELWPSRPAPQPAIQRRAATPAATMPTRPVAPVVPAPATDNQHSAAVPDAPGAFSRRLRCVDARTVYRGLASADVLALLCGGKPSCSSRPSPQRDRAARFRPPRSRGTGRTTSSARRRAAPGPRRCAASTMFEVWTQSPQRVSPLAAMSPADADAAQARARELLAVQLDQTRAQLGCD